MSKVLDPPGNIILLRGACLWLLMALVMAWCMVGLFLDVSLIKQIFPGKFSRVLQSHIDFLLMTALILGIYATKTLLPWHVRWAIVIGAFTNSSLFALQAMFPAIDSPTPPSGFFPSLFKFYLYTSLIVTSYGFGRAAVLILLSTFNQPISNRNVQHAANTLTKKDSDWQRQAPTRPALTRLFSPARRFALRRRLAQFLSPNSGHDPVLAWLIFTGLSILTFVLLWFYGLAQKMFEADITYISALIVVLYILTSLHCLWRAIAISKETRAAEQVSRIIKENRAVRLPPGAVSTHIEELKTKVENVDGGKVDQTLMLRLLADRLRGSNDFGTFASDTLMKLGLFGTIVGFIMMLAPISGLDTENSAALKSSMGAMSDGMAVAMYTTLTGLVGSILVKTQYSMVEAATEKVFASAVALTEVHVIPSLSQDRQLAP